MPLRPRLILLALLALTAACAILAGVDWWVALPEGRTAQYVGRGKCAGCHPEEMQRWTGSDHDLAMDRATGATVRGDFDDREFHHIAFEELVKLGDDDLRVLLENVEVRQLAVALHHAAAALEAKVLSDLPPARADQVRRERERLKVLRPCDVTWAQQQIGDTARRLEREGRITVDFGVHTKFFRRGDKFFVTTDNRDGRMETFQVKYVFGTRPLQQYLVEFPDGRVQCLPVAWDTDRKQWYHLYPGEPIPAGDTLHWTGPLQNWNYMCAACHTTNLQKNYDPAADTYHTTWSEIDVSCETCHGPGSLHVELAQSWGLFWDRRYGDGLPNLKSEDSRVQIDTCAPCHSRRRIVYPNPRAGEEFLDYYVPELLDGNLYYPDGQILDEDYVYGSFIQSLMYRKGVRCSDCHDPHSVRVKFDDNRLCLQCHIATTYDTPKHHHHPDASKPGTLCVECHMPETTYMVVDARRDHSLRVPRPDLTVSLGIPNACSGCHDDESKEETPEWAEAKCRQWYGDPGGLRRFAGALDAGRKGRPEGEKELAAVARRKDASAMVRASAIALLGRYPGGRAQAAALAGLEDADALVRVASVRSLQDLPADDLLRRLAPLLHDPVRAVRAEAARTLARVPRGLFNAEDAAAFDLALGEYMKGQEAVNDQAPAYLNMAVVYADLGEPDKALAAYRQSLKIDPKFVPARINLAMLFDQLGDKAAAEKQCRRILELEPKLAEAHYSLGLLLAEDAKRMQEAVGFLASAAELAPENPRIRYNYGLALQKLGRTAEAEAALKAGLKLSAGRPGSLDFLHALAILYAQTHEWTKAITCARELVRRQPENPQWSRLLQYAEQASARPPQDGPARPEPKGATAP